MRAPHGPERRGHQDEQKRTPFDRIDDKGNIKDVSASTRSVKAVDEAEGYQSSAEDHEGETWHRKDNGKRGG